MLFWHVVTSALDDVAAARSSKNVYLFVLLLVTPGVWRQVLDDNDNAPVFLHPVSRPTTLTSVEETNASAGDDVMVWNKATSGHVIARLRASDADEGLNAELRYSLVGGNDDRLFAVDRQSGDVTLNRDLRGDRDDQVHNQSPRWTGTPETQRRRNDFNIAVANIL